MTDTICALEVLTANTGTRHDCWNTPVQFVGDVVKFFGGTVDLDIGDGRGYSSGADFSVDYANVANTTAVADGQQIDLSWEVKIS